MRIRNNRNNGDDEHQAWSFQLDIYIDGVVLNNPECAKMIKGMDKAAPFWRMESAIALSKELAKDLAA